MNYIAWGASKLLELYIAETPDHSVQFCVDSYSKKLNVLGVPIVRPEAVDFSSLNGSKVVIFAASSEAVQGIFSMLTLKGLKFNCDFILYSTLFFARFNQKLEQYFSITVAPQLCRRYEAFILNSKMPHHTTVLATVLLDALLEQIEGSLVPGAIVEVGAYEGGNAMALLMLSHSQNALLRKYYVMDSYEGFPELSSLDPKSFTAGAYATGTPSEHISNQFAAFDNVTVVKGFVPESFSCLPKQESYALVFFDCDLYEPAIATFEFMWAKISPGGFLVVHDYCAEAGGFEGVKTAVDQYFSNLPVPVVVFSENTMAVIQKPWF
jgi:hypothetical protein